MFNACRTVFIKILPLTKLLTPAPARSFSSKVVRLNIARVLTVIRQTTLNHLREDYAKKTKVRTARITPA